MLNNHDIILLFCDFYNILSFNCFILMIKTYNNEVMFFSDSVKKSLGSGSGFKAFLDPDLDPDPD